MKIFQGIIWGVLLFCGTAYSFPQAAPSSPEVPLTLSDKENSFVTSDPFTNSFIRISSTDSGIKIDIKNGLLADVLQAIANQTDIRFNIASQLKQQIVNVSIVARDWGSGIEYLTKDFSKVTVWDDSSEMKKVLLLGENSWKPQGGSTIRASDNLKMPVQETITEKKVSSLSISKLKRLVQIPAGTSFPPSLFADQEIRHYLKVKGIHLPGDWKRPNKARATLHMAKKELRRLLFEKQTIQKIH